MNGESEPLLVVETNPTPNDARFLEEQLYDFNVQATGIGDGALFGVFLRGPDVRGHRRSLWLDLGRHLLCPPSLRPG
jgi:hypothetical protein